MPSSLSKQKIIQLMCVMHIFPFADPGRGVEIKDGFLFYRAVELESDADQLPGISKGLLTGHNTAEGAKDLSIPFTGTKWLLQISSMTASLKSGSADNVPWYIIAQVKVRFGTESSNLTESTLHPYDLICAVFQEHILLSPKLFNFPFKTFFYTVSTPKNPDVNNLKGKALREVNTDRSVLHRHSPSGFTDP